MSWQRMASWVIGGSIAAVADGAVQDVKTVPGPGLPAGQVDDPLGNDRGRCHDVQPFVDELVVPPASMVLIQMFEQLGRGETDGIAYPSVAFLRRDDLL
jgi:hypothetical protein